MTEKALRVLVVEDNAGDARLLREMFSKERAGSFELRHLLRMSEAVTHLGKGEVDILRLERRLSADRGLAIVDSRWRAVRHDPCDRQDAAGGHSRK